MSFRPIDMFIALNAEIEVLVDWSVFSADDVSCPSDHTTCEIDSFIQSNEYLSMRVFVKRGSHI